MALKLNSQIGQTDNSGSFNMTPMIDIVFLLIIFFLVVSQFIDAENFPVQVPEDCNFAQNQTQVSAPLTTVTVIRTDDNITFAVGSQKISADKPAGLIDSMAEFLDLQLKQLPEVDRIVTLRIDKDVRFADAQYALAGIAQSCATNIKLAVLKENR
ncbi:MAG: ExbD/TolR family protein [Planctomycetota bacterium]|jgi:biopolymer transport protein ExbD